MPRVAQRSALEGEPGTWVLDSERLGAAPRWPWVPWLPWLRWHQLALLSPVLSA